MSFDVQLPKGWARSTLGEVCEVSPTDSPLQADAPFVTMNAVEVGSRYPSRYEEKATRGGVRAQENDVLFARITPCLENGKLAQIPVGSPAVGGSTEFIVIRPGAYVIPAFLYYWCLDPVVRQRAKSMMAGATGRMRLSGKDLAQFPFLVPPLAEQYRIVEALEDHLSRLDAASSLVALSKARTTRLAVDLTRYASSSVQLEAFAKNPVSSDADDVDLPDIPATWEWKRLEEIADVVGGITKDSKNQVNTEFEEIPYLRVANVQSGHIKLDVITSIRASDAKIRKLLLEPGDVLLNEGGDRDKLGRGWVWRGEIARCIHQNHVFRVRMREELLKPELLAWHANSYGRIWFERNGKQSVNLASVSLSVIKKFPVPVPPLGEQASIVQRVFEDVESVARLKLEIGRVSLRNERLRRELLNSAFSGALVDQAPADEPASLLLERVAAERSSAPAVGRRRGSAGSKAEV